MSVKQKLELTWIGKENLPGMPTHSFDKTQDRPFLAGAKGKDGAGQQSRSVTRYENIAHYRHTVPESALRRKT
jgi:hypothetical protein